MFINRFIPAAFLLAACAPWAYSQSLLAPTPPMGWNSWDSFGTTITEAEVKANDMFGMGAAGDHTSEIEALGISVAKYDRPIVLSFSPDGERAYKLIREQLTAVDSTGRTPRMAAALI